MVPNKARVSQTPKGIIYPLPSTFYLPLYRYASPALDLKAAAGSYLDSGDPTLLAGWSFAICLKQKKLSSTKMVSILTSTKMVQKATYQAAAEFLPEKLHCCEGLAMLRWSRCQCQCHWFLPRVLQGENPPLRWSLSTRTWGAGVPASWWHQAPGSHDWTTCEQKYYRIAHRAVSGSTSYNSVEAIGRQVW